MFAKFVTVLAVVLAFQVGVASAVTCYSCSGSDLASPCRNFSAAAVGQCTDPSACNVLTLTVSGSTTVTRGCGSVKPAPPSGVSYEQRFTTCSSNYCNAAVAHFLTTPLCLSALIMAALLALSSFR